MPVTYPAPQRPRTEASARLRVLVASDQPLVADAVHAALLSQGLEAIATPLARGSSTPGQVNRLLLMEPTVLLVISDLSRAGRLEGASTLVEDLRLPSVVLASSEEDPTWGAMLESGASVVLPVSATLEDVVQTLRAVSRGVVLLTSGRREALIQAWRRTVRERYELARRLATLTPREREVLRMLYLGETVQQIAERTGLASGTVRSHVRSMLRKLGVSSQLAAVAVYAQLGTLGDRV